jgi:hypothetical protein
MTTRSLEYFIFGVAMLLASNCGSLGRCDCVWEGAVIVKPYDQRAEDDTHLDIRANLERQPCCEDSKTTTANYRVHVETGATEKIAEPAGPGVGARDSTSIKADFATAGVRVVLAIQAEDSISATTVKIGEIRDLSSDNLIAEVTIDVGE